MTPANLPSFAVIGRCGAGKSTVAEILVKQFGYEKLSFAAPLKVMCGTTTDRALLQDVGVGVRALCEDAWVNLLRDRLENIDERTRLVIDDCRFPNEAQMLLEQGFRFIRVVAPTTLRIARLTANGKYDPDRMEHESETALDDFEAHHRIVNDGWSTALESRIVEILNKERW